MFASLFSFIFQLIGLATIIVLVAILAFFSGTVTAFKLVFEAGQVQRNDATNKDQTATQNPGAVSANNQTSKIPAATDANPPAVSRGTPGRPRSGTARAGDVRSMTTRAMANGGERK